MVNESIKNAQARIKSLTSITDSEQLTHFSSPVCCALSFQMIDDACIYKRDFYAKSLDIIRCFIVRRREIHSYSYVKMT